MKNRENAIEVDNITKKFRIYYDKGGLLKEKVIFHNRNKYEEREVLRGVSFDVKKGEAVGLIGHNGCGKSTTLKLLTGIMYPDSGDVRMQGRVSSLLELGAGFHPDMSGRENVYINASIFGLSKKEIDKRMNDIIEFSELAEFMDNPVRTYSSGMYMRLAFSVAINVNADILLIDEILAVGDINFQDKCFNRLMEIKKQGTTIVLVSHSTDQIERLCDRSIWIHEGLVKADGNAREVDTQYLRYMGEQRFDRQKESAEPEEAQNEVENEGEAIEPKVLSNSGYDVEHKPRIAGNGKARIICINSYDENGELKSVFEAGAKVTFRVKYRINQPLTDTYFGLSIFRNDGMRCYGINSKINNIVLNTIDKDGEFEITFPSLNLLQGQYYVDVCIATQEDNMIDYLDGVNEFEIYNASGELGVCRFPCEWKV